MLTSASLAPLIVGLVAATLVEATAAAKPPSTSFLALRKFCASAIACAGQKFQQRRSTNLVCRIYWRKGAQKKKKTLKTSSCRAF